MREATRGSGKVLAEAMRKVEEQTPRRMSTWRTDVISSEVVANERSDASLDW